MLLRNAEFTGAGYPHRGSGTAGAFRAPAGNALISPVSMCKSRSGKPTVPRPSRLKAQASESRTRAPKVPRGEMNAPAFASVTVIPCSRSRATAASAFRTVSAIMNIPSP